jgi:type I restriction enzyme R subunit
MPSPGEHKTVQAHILAYAREIGWTYVPRGKAEKRRGFDHSGATPAEQAAEASPYFDDLLDSQVRKLNPKYADGPGALVGDPRPSLSSEAKSTDDETGPRGQAAPAPGTPWQ